MSELSNIFKSFCNATNKKMLGFNKEYDIIFENGFDTESINQLQHLIQLLEDKNKKTVLSLSGESYSLNIVKINNEEYYLVVKVPEFFDDSYSDPFLKEQGAFFDSLDNDVVVMRDTQVIFRNKKMLKVLGLSEENALEPYKKLQPQHSLQKFNEFLRTKTSGNVTLEINDKNKKIRLVKASISYIIYNGIGYHISIVKDIEQMKDIEFDNEADKLKVYTEAVSNKTAKEWGTKHANQLKPYDIKYKDNDYYKQNYISRLHDIINQDTMKTRGGTKTNTIENKIEREEIDERRTNQTTTKGRRRTERSE